MARFASVCGAAPALVGILAGLLSFWYAAPPRESLSVAQVTSDGSGHDATKTVEGAADTPEEIVPDQRSRVTLRANSLGHFSVTADINGMPVEMMADTGATYVALTFKTALSLGLQPSDLPFTKQTDTANGVTAVAPVTLDEVRVGDIAVRRVRAVVTAPGRLRQNLLGMSFINRLSRFEMSGQRLTLTQ